MSQGFPAKIKDVFPGFDEDYVCSVVAIPRGGLTIFLIYGQNKYYVFDVAKKFKLKQVLLVVIELLLLLHLFTIVHRVEMDCICIMYVVSRQKSPFWKVHPSPFSLNRILNIVRLFYTGIPETPVIVGTGRTESLSASRVSARRHSSLRPKYEHLEIHRKSQAW